MKGRLRTRLPDGVPPQVALRAILAHFEDKWEPEAVELTEERLTITSPQRCWLGKYYARRRQWGSRWVVHCICVSVAEDALAIEVTVTNVAMAAPLLGLVILLCIAAFEPGALVALPFVPILLLPVFMHVRMIAGAIRKQIKKAVAALVVPAE